MPAFVLLCFALLSVGSFGQHRNDNWIFPQNQWVGFGSGSPLWASGGNVLGLQGCASISDPDGALLFYVDRFNIYNAIHQIMLNGDGTWPDNTTQGNLILPRPGTVAEYSVFLNEGAMYSRAGYVVVDMTQDGGLGSVVDPAVQWYMDSTTAKLTATPHGNGEDYWILHHEWETDEFYAYLFTSLGLDTVPVISNAGSVHQRLDTVYFEPLHRSGPMKISYQGDRIALSASSDQLGAYPGEAIVELFSFDDQTGQVTFLAALPGHTRVSGIEFSPNGDFLYLIDEIYSAPPVTELWQFAMDVLVEDSIQASAYLLTQFSDSSFFAVPHHGMTLAPDGKIYYRYFADTPWLGVISAPDEAHAACAPAWQGFQCGGPLIFGLPNQCKRYHDSQLSVGAQNVHDIDGRFLLRPNPLSMYGVLTTPYAVKPNWLSWFDAQGRLVRTDPPAFMDGGMRVERMDLKTGVYTLEVLGMDGPLGRVKVVLE